MAQTTQPVPQWAHPFLGDVAELEKLNLRFNPVWLKWFLDLVDQLSTGGGVEHNTLSGLQGAGPAFFHLEAVPSAAGLAVLNAANAAAQRTALGLSSSVSGTFPVDGAVAGTLSSITVVNGLITVTAVR